MVESQPTRDNGDVFVGRQTEMAELTATLDAALTGQGRIVMLAGEPGIGKTRAAQELAVLAEQRGRPDCGGGTLCLSTGAARHDD